MDVIKKEFTNKEIKSNRFYLSSDQAKIEDQRVTSYETKIRSHIHEVIHNRSIEDILDDLEDDLEDDFTIPTPGPTRA
jgi:hypothetical protein